MTAALTGLSTVFDWTIEQNELSRLQVPVLDADGVAFSVAGWTVDATIKTQPGGTTLHTWAAGDIAIATSTVTLTILPATSLAWTFRSGWWRMCVQHPSDVTQRHRIVEGRFRVRFD